MGMTVQSHGRGRNLTADELHITLLSLLVEGLLELLRGPEPEYDWYDLQLPRYPTSFPLPSITWVNLLSYIVMLPLCPAFVTL